MRRAGSAPSQQCLREPSAPGSPGALVCVSVTGGLPPFAFRRSLQLQTDGALMKRSKVGGLLLRLVLGTMMATTLLPTSAPACVVISPRKLEDVRRANVVVVGQISDYRFFRDESFRKEMLSSPNLTPDMREAYKDPNRIWGPDYGEFEVKVDQVLAGRAPRKVLVIMRGSSLPPPVKMEPGRYLVALHRPSPARPSEARASSPYYDPNAMTPLEQPCAGAFIFKADSPSARTIQGILQKRRK